MAKRLEVIVSTGEIVIRSSTKYAAPNKLQLRAAKGRKRKTSARL
jgi:hypothetical protein